VRAKLKDLMFDVDAKIEAAVVLVYDVAAMHGQLFDNVKHLAWFRRAVAQELINTRARYAHLEVP
jgi:hypothetical protein